MINNASGTASPITGLLASFGFNEPKKPLIVQQNGSTLRR